MSLRSGTQKYSLPKDEWVTNAEGQSGYNRNLYLEKILEEEVSNNRKEYDHEFKGGLNPTHWAYDLPSWWRIIQHEFGEPYADGYQQQGYTKQDALEFCRIVIKINKAHNAWDSYRCSNYPRDPVYCRSRNIGNFEEYARILEKEISEEGLNILPTLEGFTQGVQYASAEEDPSILQSDEVVTVTPGQLTWYYVKKPSGICERLNVSQNFVNQMTSQGWIFSLTDICATEPEPEEPQTDVVDPPGVAETSCYMVHGQKLELTEQAVGYYINAGVTVTPCEENIHQNGDPPPEPTPTPTPTGLANFGIAGILFAGVLALPILSGLGKWK